MEQDLTLGQELFFFFFNLTIYIQPVLHCLQKYSCL